ncbi:hypothetical protein ACN20G_25835 [Streptomyces sp. BI20]|uniref:hypothetical protein n=1 Tax=Streptomyces sp. BI20 TaxID=3403460 RepID=UPI003C74BA85
MPGLLIMIGALLGVSGWVYDNEDLAAAGVWPAGVGVLAAVAGRLRERGRARFTRARRDLARWAERRPGGPGGAGGPGGGRVERL